MVVEFKTRTKRLIDINEVNNALDLILEPRQVFEVRVLDGSLENSRYKQTLAGYFKNTAESKALLFKYLQTIKSCMGIYITPQVCHEDLIHRIYQVLEPQQKGYSTSDSVITRYRWFLVDSDPKRISHISSTDSEHENAHQHSQAIKKFLRDLGFSEPIDADSGNGKHLLYRIDLPNTPEIADKDNGLITRALLALSQQFDEGEVNVDTSVGNPARIWKLYGTLACKGSDTPERPHRMAHILEAPDEIEVVTREQLEALANLYKPSEQTQNTARRPASGSTQNKNDFDLYDFCRKHSIAIKSEDSYEDGKRLLLEACAWNPDHTDNCACLYQFPDGRLGASCSHESCKGKGWKEFRLVFEPDAYDGKTQQDSKPTSSDQASILVKMTLESSEVFSTSQGEAYARVHLADRIETMPISEKGALKRWIIYEYRQRTGVIPQATAITSAIEVLAAEAEWAPKEKQDVYVRVAHYQGNIYIDIANKESEVVEISAKGWKVIKDAPVCFRRPDGMLPLPRPVPGGNLAELKHFLNVRDGDDWLLIQAWLLGTVHTGPYAILGLNGEGGSAKTSLERKLRGFIDPHKAPVRKEPKDDQTFAIMAHNNYIVALDNLSHISTKLSDMMCTLATGAGDAFRKHYSNDEECIFSTRRPQIFTGIEELATRGDLIDRCILISLPIIDPKKRQDEKTLDKAFNEAHPRMLGAFFDVVSLALRKLPYTHIEELPRMADFALWVQAAESALTDKPGAFLAAYTRNKEKGIAVELEASPIGKAVLDLMDTTTHWHGATSELLHALKGLVEEEVTYQRAWPKNARALSGSLRRLAPSLRIKNVNVVQDRDNKGSWVDITFCEAEQKSDANQKSFDALCVTGDANSDANLAKGDANQGDIPTNSSHYSSDIKQKVTQSDANFNVSSLTQELEEEIESDEEKQKNSSRNLRHFASPNGNEVFEL